MPARGAYDAIVRANGRMEYSRSVNRDAVILCVPDAPAAGERHLFGQVAGLPVITRQVAAVLRAGVERVMVVVGAEDAPQVQRALDTHRLVREAGPRVTVTPASTHGISGLDLPDRYVLLRSDHLHEPAHLKRAVAEGGVRDLDDAAGVPVRTAAERDAATAALCASLRKSVDGPVSRHLNRPMSLAVTRRLLGTDITPNQMTVVANVIGAVGVWLVFQATWTTLALGAILVHTQSVLDGCDGELARLKFLSSRFGEWFDNVADNLVNSAYGMSLGFATAELMGWPAFRWIGIASAMAFVFYDCVVYAQLALVHRTGNPFAFRWWFQKTDADLTETFEGGGRGARVAAFFRALGRRDVFLFAFMWLSLVRLPWLASLWYAALAAGHLVMTILHLARGGMPRTLGAK